MCEFETGARAGRVHRIGKQLHTPARLLCGIGTTI